MEKLKDFYDFIIIDCMPSLGMLTINALACADSVLIPVQAGISSGQRLTAADKNDWQGKEAVESRAQNRGDLIDRW